LPGNVELQLKPLCALRDRKETYVDSEIEAMIRSEDFQGISKFLAPLAVSSDQLKRQKWFSDQYQSHDGFVAFLPTETPL
jgi:hypothetical protein